MELFYLWSHCFLILFNSALLWIVNAYEFLCHVLSQEGQNQTPPQVEVTPPEDQSSNGTTHGHAEEDEAEGTPHNKTNTPFITRLCVWVIVLSCFVCQTSVMSHLSFWEPKVMLACWDGAGGGLLATSGESEDTDFPSMGTFTTTR